MHAGSGEGSSKPGIDLTDLSATLLVMSMLFVMFIPFSSMLLWRLSAKYMDDMLTDGYALAMEILKVKIDGSRIHICTAIIPLNLVDWSRLANSMLNLLHSPALLTSVNGGKSIILVADQLPQMEGSEPAWLCPPPIIHNASSQGNCTLESYDVYVGARNLSIELRSVDHIRFPLILNGTPIERITIIGTDKQGRTVEVDLELTVIPQVLLSHALGLTLAVYVMVAALLYTVLEVEATGVSKRKEFTVDLVKPIDSLRLSLRLLVREFLSLLGKRKVIFLIAPYITLSTLLLLTAAALFVNDNILGSVTLSLSFIVSLAIVIVLLLLPILASWLNIIYLAKRQAVKIPLLPTILFSLAYIIIYAGPFGPLVLSATRTANIVLTVLLTVLNAITTAYSVEPLKTVLATITPIASSLLASTTRTILQRKKTSIEPPLVLAAAHTVVALILLTPLLNPGHVIIYNCRESMLETLIFTIIASAGLAAGISLSGLLRAAREPPTRTFALSIMTLIPLIGIIATATLKTLIPAILAILYLYPLLLALILLQLASLITRQEGGKQ